ncbi:MAG: PGF-pre-PGF domain-containing protein [Candidatus Methanoperedens sp.]|nr:PGF-pre-PGF domain-containing protein [Candidatus Methanoperedens sp.]MCE8428842.1 PGF-pre-PGF domain-containing protein [Candidatus Methanoperedens sp.]
MNRKKLSLLVLTVLIIAGIAEAQDQVPINPAPGYYGSVTVNGQPAPQGTTIIAKIGNEERGAITTSVSGSYGDDPGPSKLWVTGYRNEIGSSVTFYMSGIAAQQTAHLTDAGAINRVDLSFIIPSGQGGTSNGGGGSGSGGGGVVSSEPFENIEFYEIREADLIAGMPVTFRFTNPQIAVYELVITANISAGLTSAKIEHLKGTSRLVTSPPAGTIYKNLSIWLGTSGFAVPKNIREGIVRFRVNNSWLSGENIDANQVSMMKWDGSQWRSLETKELRSDDTFTFYEAMTDTFSPFAITGVKVAPTGTPVTTSTPDVSPTSAPLAVVPPSTSLNLILYVIVAIIIVAAVYYYAAKKKVK